MRGYDSRKMLAVCLFGALVTLVAPYPASAETIAGVEYDSVAKTPSGDLELCSAALLRYLTVFKGYTAALYLDDCGKQSDALSDTPKRLELSYFWSIEADQISSAADTLLGESLDDKAMANLRPRLDRLHKEYRSIKPGDRYRLTYAPGTGTELALNGKPLITIEGADFAEAYFGIWLGEKPLDVGLRDELLGRK